MSLKHSSAVFCAHAAILDVYNNISLIFLQHLYNNTIIKQYKTENTLAFD